MIKRLRITRQQKEIIEEQKEVVEIQKKEVDIAYDQLEEKNREILDSINYAKRIQSAILPPAKLVKEYLKESFILYLPKDIVAGDFYWMESYAKASDSAGAERGVLFAAADCTGHGVPGAMVSVICNNGLNRSVREYGLTDPGQILDKTREIVIQEFNPEASGEEEVKDGMDIALCSIEGMTLTYAGANNPLWIIRKGEVLETKASAETSLNYYEEFNCSLIQVKADKQPIGKFIDPKPYTSHSFDLKSGDLIYVFSDGYVDQFGGEKGKKFKPSNFRKLLLSIDNMSMEKQKQLLESSFNEWKGDLEQIDDVCVIGVRV